ncbi:MAG: ribonuclease HII, partial [Thermodesulfobacteriota bacterium]
ENYHNEYPQYNFTKHKGYPTKEHIEALKKFGACPIHRRSYSRVLNIT